MRSIDWEQKAEAPRADAELIATGMCVKVGWAIRLIDPHLRVVIASESEGEFIVFSGGVEIAQ